ncbi:hypothetical protein DUZ99_15890 [Xylanibacillus composti]|nr:hypothetical protein [Xylanibacillus composti]
MHVCLSKLDWHEESVQDGLRTDGGHLFLYSGRVVWEVLGLEGGLFYKLIGQARKREEFVIRSTWM